jgi:hypothetical protein
MEENIIKNGDMIVYGHLSKFEVQNGQFVKEGNLLGLTGGAVGSPNSGKTTGSHCHISQYHNGILVDPTPYIFNHVQQNNSSPFLFPIMLILLGICMYRFRKAFKVMVYLFIIFLVLLVIFILS